MSGNTVFEITLEVVIKCNSLHVPNADYIKFMDLYIQDPF